MSELLLQWLNNGNDMIYESRTLSMIHLPKGEPIFVEAATVVRIVDEAAGEFVEVSQEDREGHGKIGIDPDEWPSLRDLIDRMVGECRPEKEG